MAVADESADIKWFVRVVPVPPKKRLDLVLGTHSEPTWKRTTRAAALLLERDAALISALRRRAPEPLSWMFDPRPGYEAAHDRGLDSVLPLLLPRRVTDSLYPFQRRGVAWLLCQARAILADDMGLGKTVQVIAALRRLVRAGRISSSLVVVPRTLLDTWDTEAKRWAPELVTHRYRTNRGGGSARAWSRSLNQAHILFTSYEELRTPSRQMIELPPDLIVADEAHRLRKADSLTHRGLRQVPAPRFWALTGTPVENNAKDLAGILSLLEPSVFSVDDHRYGVVSLRARARPYILRRTKHLVQPELVKPLEIEEVVALSGVQRRAYDWVIKEHQPGIPGSSLQLFNRLRRICDLDEQSGSSSKLDRAMEIIRASLADTEKVVVFSYTIAPLLALRSRIRSKLGDVVEVLIGEQSLEKRQRVVERFKSDPCCGVLLTSMRIGGEGLTLTEANHVIMVNRWWNPSTNSQAIDRVVRIGQTRPVTVHYLVCRDTVEDRLKPLLDRKKMTFVQLIEALQYHSDTANELLGT